MPTTSGIAAAGAPACTAADLKASHGLVAGAAGSRVTSVVLDAQVACSIDAFPAFGLANANAGPGHRRLGEAKAERLQAAAAESIAVPELDAEVAFEIGLLLDQ
jgi:hypothetical protein